MLTQLRNSGAFTKADLDACNRNFNLTGGLAYGAAARGQIFCVDAVNGNNIAGDGTPEKPFATITRAHEFCVSGRGDSIVVQAGTYAESVDITKDYVTLIGMTIGGYARPDLEPATAAEAALTINGQGCAVVHIRCAANGGDAMVQRGNGFLITDCVLDGDATAAKAGLRLLPSDTDDSYTASEGRVFGNYFRGSAIGVCFDTGAAPAVGVGSTHNRIYDNTFTANTLDFATADTGGGVYSVQFTQIGPGNVFQDKNKATYMDFTTANGGAASAQTGVICGNQFAADFGVGTAPTTTQIKMVGTGLVFTGNFGSIGVADGSGLD